METRANYVLIGAFAVAGFLGLLGFLSTVAFARYLLKQAETHGENAEEDQ